MGEEWYCECGHTQSSEPESQTCPGCGLKMSLVDDFGKELERNDYDEDDPITPIEDLDEEDLATDYPGFEADMGDGGYGGRTAREAN